MIATITSHSYRMSNTQDHRFSRSSNTASAPLPLVPRRSSGRVQNTVCAPNSDKVITLNASTSPLPIPKKPLRKYSDDSDSSSSSPSDNSRPTVNRVRRVRGVRVPTQTTQSSSPPLPTSQSTPFPMRLAAEEVQVDAGLPRPALSRPMVYTPGMSLKLCVDSIKSRSVSDSQAQRHAETSAQGACPTLSQASDGRPLMIRKKSGQLVKSSLKMTKSTRGNLSVLTLGSSSKSEPATPTISKAVHFDTQLEHVKLFLAEQKPLAVSRDGSPTEDTSGTDSDFPSFIFGKDGEERRSKKKLVMQISNMPARINTNADVVLEELSLSSDGTNIVGRTRVRNLDFAKWVAIRFTFDSWQTTSEVTGRYVESIDKQFDRFAFNIKLNDLLARIEGKTLLLAIRYNVASKEFWDNNNGRNYCASFTKTKADRSKQSDEESASDIDNLRSKLEQVMQSTERTGPAFLSSQSRRVPATRETDPPFFKTATSLASRYDFAASLKKPWIPASSPPRHNRVQSYPQSLGIAPTASSIPWPEKGVISEKDLVSEDQFVPRGAAGSLGSPRDIEDHFFLGTKKPSEVEDYPFAIPARDNRFVRNHHRGNGDFNKSGSGVRRTPPGSPPMLPEDSPNPLLPSSPTPPSSRSHSFPPIDSGRATGGTRPAPLAPAFALESSSGESELSTPPIVTPTSSRSPTPSPTEAEAFMNCMLSPSDSDDDSSSETSYRQFLDRFCFFTGSQTFGDAISDISKTHSASDLQDFFAGTSPRLNSPPSVLVTPRSASADDIAFIKSGSSTPTTPTMTSRESRSSTPVAR